MNGTFEDSFEFSISLDLNDCLSYLRSQFYIQEDVIYMCGNSLGLASNDAEKGILKVIEIWKSQGVMIWNVEDGKYSLYSKHIASLMAPIVGADPEEIAIVESTTTNIHQMISTFYNPTNEKYKILVDNINFPTDRYAIDSQVKLKGLNPKDAVKVVEAKDFFMDEDDIINAMTEEVAIVFLPLVYYRTAQIVDMKKISSVAKERGIIIGWDLSHGVGAIEINLKSADVDFAVWCTYKYLNGGPGSPAALYVNRRHFQRTPGLAGWFGNKFETQFMMRQEYEHQEDASGWQIGTPPLLSMATLEGSLKIIQEAGLRNIRMKSLHLTAYLMFLIDNKLVHYGFEIGNLRDGRRRGGHVCLKHDEGYRISLALKTRGVISDFRDPNMIRLTPTALYTRFVDVYKMVDILDDIMKKKVYEEFSNKRLKVV